jgi:hypothetical protein
MYLTVQITYKCCEAAEQRADPGFQVGPSCAETSGSLKCDWVAALASTTNSHHVAVHCLRIFETQSPTTPYAVHSVSWVLYAYSNCQAPDISANASARLITPPLHLQPPSIDTAALRHKHSNQQAPPYFLISRPANHNSTSKRITKTPTGVPTRPPWPHGTRTSSPTPPPTSPSSSAPTLAANPTATPTTTRSSAASCARITRKKASLCPGGCRLIRKRPLPNSLCLSRRVRRAGGMVV